MGNDFPVKLHRQISCCNAKIHHQACLIVKKFYNTLNTHLYTNRFLIFKCVAFALNLQVMP